MLVEYMTALLAGGFFAGMGGLVLFWLPKLNGS
jgi:hypothetical protein